MGKLSEIADFHPPRQIARGASTNFIDMAAVAVGCRDVESFEKKVYKGSGSRFTNGDTLLARITPCLENGKTAQVSGLPEGENAFGSTEFIVIAAKEPSIDRDYLYYLARLPLFRSFAISRMEGTSGRQRVSWQAVADFEYLFPCPEIRSSGASLLKQFDDMIQSNRIGASKLEELAQAIFKSWFVDFDPVKAKLAAVSSGRDPELAAMATLSGMLSVSAGKPKPETIEEMLPSAEAIDEAVSKLASLGDEQEATLAKNAALFPEDFADSDLGLIPKGWEAKPLYETAEFINGAAFKAADFTDYSDAMPIIKIAELKQGISGQTKFTQRDMPEKYRIDNGALLYSWSGSPSTSLEVFKWFGGEGWLNQHIFKICTSTEAEKIFVWLLLKHLKPELIRIAENKQTTGLGHVTVADMKRLLVAYPPASAMEAFGQLLQPIYDKHSSNILESGVLADLRDALLPKLLSGQIKIKD